MDFARDAEASARAREDRARWYVIQARARQTERAEANLQRQGYRVYCPRLCTERIRRNRRLRVEVPLFANYLFIHLHEWHDNWYPLRSTRGVARLVTGGRFASKLCNLFISNVPGPQQTLYMNGARLLHTYGMAPLADGMGLFIATPSYAGEMSFNVISDREMLPDIDFFRECIENAFEELLALG